MKTQEAQVIMLPTNKASKLGFAGNSLSFSDCEGNKTSFYIPQHLYFISDEPIKEGDWILYNIHSNAVFQGYNKYDEKTIVTKYASAVHQNIRYCKKVIATTNPDLWSQRRTFEGIGFDTDGIPKIPIEFIEVYVKEQGKIDIVLLEVIYVMPQANGTRTDGKIIDEISLDPIHNTMFVPKLKSNGSVIVHPVKETDWEKAVKAMHILSKKEKGSLMALTAAAIGMDEIDMLDVLNIVQENTSAIHSVKEKMYSKEEVIGLLKDLRNGLLTVNKREIDITNNFIEQHL